MQPGVLLPMSAALTSAKRKPVGSKSPQALAIAKQAKQQSQESIGFKTLGGGKASYLTNAGGTAA